MNAKQERFVAEYLVDLNATQAAIRAGYSERTAGSQGERLLRNAEVIASLSRSQQRVANKLEVTAERVLREASRIAFGDTRKLFDEAGRLRPIHDLDDDAAAMVASIEVVSRVVPGSDPREIEYVHKIRTWDKVAALTNLMRHLALFNDRTTNVNINVSLESLVEASFGAPLIEGVAVKANGSLAGRG